MMGSQARLICAATVCVIGAFVAGRLSCRDGNDGNVLEYSSHFARHEYYVCLSAMMRGLETEETAAAVDEKLIVWAEHSIGKVDDPEPFLVLASIAPRSRRAVELLRVCLRSENRSVRVHTVGVLPNMSQTALQELREDLVQQLASDDSDVYLGPRIRRLVESLPVPR